MQVGDTRTLELPKITRTTLALYAGASGDHNPMHIDIDACRSVGVEDVFAHGMLSMAYLGRLVTDWVPQERVKSYWTRFVAITPVNETPTAHGQVVDVTDGQATLELRMTLSDGTETLLGGAVVEVA